MSRPAEELAVMEGIPGCLFIFAVVVIVGIILKVVFGV